MGPSEISQFLTWLAVDRRVSASTQNQAFSALLFLLKSPLDWLRRGYARASRVSTGTALLLPDRNPSLVNHLRPAGFLGGAWLRAGVSA